MRLSRFTAVASLALTMLSCGSQNDTATNGKVTVLLKDLFPEYYTESDTRYNTQERDP